LENLNINEELSTFKTNSGHDLTLIEDKLGELIDLLDQASLDNETIQELQGKFNAALRVAANSTTLQPYSRSARTINAEEVEGELEQLLFINNLDRKTQRKHNASRVVALTVRVVIALLLILLGFGMIIMPAPPYFEMFTLFYLNANDGVTIMDVISLIVAFTGVYLLISAITNLRGR